MTEKPQSADLFPGPGFRIRTRIERPEPALIERLGAFGTPDVSDAMNRLYTLSRELRNVVGGGRLLGPACTVEVYPGDNLMVHKALDVAQPGDVIVVHAGNAPNGIIGDLIATKAMHRGVAGFVIDGLVRDVDGIRETGLPVFAHGVTPRGPLHRGPGEINFPIACGGTVVQPGDVILGDECGLVVARRESLGMLVERLEARARASADYEAAVRAGDFSNAWVDRLLEAQGCQREGDG